MGYSRFYTASRLLRHPLPYSPATNPLSETVHLRPGSKDGWVPTGGTAERRPGFERLGNAIDDHRIRHVEVAEEGSLAATVWNESTSRYEIWVKPPGDDDWTKIPEKREIHDSRNPHEMIWIGRMLYAKGDPTTDEMGEIIYDLDDEETHWWGVLAPEDGPTLAAIGDWLDATADFDVVRGFRYAYTYVTTTGHESSRSPWTDLSGESTDKQPRMTIPTRGDRTNIPKINIYRSGDGGGPLYLLEQIDNTTGSAITYNDDNFETGRGFLSQVNQSRPIPGFGTNDPPPTRSSGTIGTDPIVRSSPLAEWAGRIFYAIENIIFWSVNDEALPGTGRLQESFRGGSIFRANRAQVREKVLDLRASTDGLYIFTTKNTYIVTGERRNELRVRLLFPDIGIHDRHCSVAAGGTVLWLDQNLDLRSTARGVDARGTIPDILSTPLNGEQRDYLTRYIRLDAHHIPDYLWISIYAGQTGSDGEPVEANAVLYVYDATRQFWFPPWNLTACAVWERFRVAKYNGYGKFDESTHQDFGSDIEGRIVTSCVHILGEENLNVSNIDFEFQILEAIELTWQGANLTNQVEVGLNVNTAAGIGYDADLLLGTNRSDTPGSDFQGMNRGTFWLPDDSGEARYFNLNLTIPADNARWSLMSAAMIFMPRLSDTAIGARS